MNLTLRLFLLFFAVITSIWIIRKIKKSKIKVNDMVFWMFLSVLLVIQGIIPEVSFYMAGVMGIQSPANFLFLMLIFLLIEKVFTLSILVSRLEDKVENLSAELALRSKVLEDKIERKKQGDMGYKHEIS